MGNFSAIDYMILLKTFFGTWFFTHFDPIRDKFAEYFLKLPATEINNGALSLLTCWKCQSFWITLAFTFDFFQAAAVSFLVWILQQMSERR